MNKNIVITLGVLIALGLGWYALDRAGEEPHVSEHSRDQLHEGGPLEEGLSERAEYHEVSLLAMRDKEFSGTNLTLGQKLTESDSYTRYYITYKSGNLTISGIMNVPKGNGPFPVLILNHGYIDPAIYTNGRGLRREQDYLARQGFVVIHPDYRNHAQSDKDPSAELSLRLGYVEDVINVVNAVKNSELAFLDKNKIGMLGHSMGGGIAQSIMVAKPDLVGAFVLYAPVSSDYRDSFERWTTQRREIAEQIIKTYGSPDQNKEFWDGVSPRTYFADVTAPIQFHHGTADKDVPYDWSVTSRDALTKLDKQAELFTYQGEGHEFGLQWPTFMERTAQFFKTEL